MSLHKQYSLPKQILLYLLIFTTGLALAVNVYGLISGVTIIFQNLYFFPIIIASLFYLKKGFLFSLLLILTYGASMLFYTNDMDILFGTFIRMGIFTFIAGSTTYLSTLRLQTTDIQLQGEKKYRHLFNSIDIGVMVHEIIRNDPDNAINFRLLEANPAFERITGHHLTNIIRKTLDETQFVTDIDWRSIYQKVAQSGKEIHFDQYDNKIEKYFEISVYVLEQDKMVTLIREISDRKQQENLLRESNEYLDNLITLANVPIIVWDQKFQITRINHAFELLIGQSSENILGKTLSTLFPPNQTDRCMRLVQTTQNGVKWESVEIPIIHKDGSVREILWNSSTIYTSDGKTPIATIAQGRDITKEKILVREKEKAMVKIQENIAQLAILNDGIRNPLTIITTYADMIEDSHLVECIQNEVIRIDEMVNNLDKEWIYSKKILNYLRKQDLIIR